MQINPTETLRSLLSSDIATQREIEAQLVSISNSTPNDSIGMYISVLDSEDIQVNTFFLQNSFPRWQS